MLATLLIVFREAIEAGLIIGIVCAATRGVAGRGKWIGLGIALGIVGACLVAACADSLSNLVAGAGQEVFNAVVMAVAVVMLTGHNVWMAREGRQMGQDMQALGDDVVGGKRSLAALSVVVGVALLREGSEIALFLYGIALSEGNGAATMFLGGTIGVALGAGVSALMYFGLLRIPTRHVFKVTSQLIALVAAGMAAQAIAFLQAGGLVSVFAQTMWDTSRILSEHSLLGKALHSLVGYTDRPSGLQVLVYLTTLAIIFGLMKLLGHPPMVKKPNDQGSAKLAEV
jgi:high-affinity iron transporter